MREPNIASKITAARVATVPCAFCGVYGSPFMYLIWDYSQQKLILAAPLRESTKGTLILQPLFFCFDFISTKSVGERIRCAVVPILDAE